MIVEAQKVHLPKQIVKFDRNALIDLQPKHPQLDADATQANT